MAGDVQTSLKFSKFPVSGGPKYCVYPVSKGQAWTLSWFFFRLPVSRLLSHPNRYLLRCDESLLFCLSAKVQQDSGYFVPQQRGVQLNSTSQPGC